MTNLTKEKRGQSSRTSDRASAVEIKSLTEYGSYGEGLERGNSIRSQWRAGKRQEDKFGNSRDTPVKERRRSEKKPL